MQYLVIGSECPGFASEDEANIVINKLVLPTFKKLQEWETNKTIPAGGLPVGDRALVFIMEASSNEALDQLLRGLPMWGSCQWEVSPLTGFSARASRDAKGV